MLWLQISTSITPHLFSNLTFFPTDLNYYCKRPSHPSWFSSVTLFWAPSQPPLSDMCSTSSFIMHFCFICLYYMYCINSMRAKWALLSLLTYGKFLEQHLAPSWCSIKVDPVSTSDICILFSLLTGHPGVDFNSFQSFIHYITPISKYSWLPWSLSRHYALPTELHR